MIQAINRMAASILTSLAPGPTDDYWYSSVGPRTLSGVSVTDESALTFAAVFCATRVICEAAAQLPLKGYQTLLGGGRAEADNHPTAALLRSINPRTTPMAFREGRTMHSLNAGNGFAEIQRNTLGYPAVLWPIHPSRVRKYFVDENGGLVYEVTNKNGSKSHIPAADMLHITGTLSDDGISGKGIVTQARESIGYGLATEQHGSGMMACPIPAYAITGPRFADPNYRKDFREDWDKIHSASNRRQPAMLPNDTKIEKLSLSQIDIEFLSTRKDHRNVIATWYKVPPHMMGDTSSATFNNVEQYGIQFVVYCLMPWLVRWEQSMNAKLWTQAERDAGYYFEHNVSGLLRGDIATRLKAYHDAIQGGWMSPNDARRLENMNPIPGGDIYVMQSQMTTLENIASGASLKQSGDPRAKLAEADLAFQKQIDQLANSFGPRHAELKEAAMLSLDRMHGLRRMLKDGICGLAAKIDGVADSVEDLRGDIADLRHDRLAPPQVILQQLPAPEVPALGAPYPGDQLIEVKTATRKAFEERLSRLVAKECNEVRLAFLTPAGKPRPLKKAHDRLEKFYAKHEALMAQELAAVAESCNAAGWQVDLTSGVVSYIAGSRDMLAEQIQGSGELSPLLDAWKENRVGGFCETIFKGEESNG